MSADIEFERRVRSDLRSALDRTAGPHPDWATSPAAAIVAADPMRRSGRVPWRLLAVAALLVVGSVAAAVLSSQDNQDAGVPGCPTLADYAAASAQPTPLQGTAPGVAFPSVAPTASMTTGLLQPGEWAVIANAKGPGLQLRIRDVRECGRLPDIRSYEQDGSIYLVTVDARILRDDAGLSWVSARSLFDVMVGESQELVRPAFGVPGADDRTSLTTPGGYSVSTTLVLDLPANDKLVALVHPGDSTDTLPGLEPTAPDWPRVGWVIRAGDPTGRGLDDALLSPMPDATPTTGEIQVGQDVAMVTESGAGLIRLTNIGEVPAYPGLVPAPGHVFVEVLVRQLDMGNSHVSLQGWRATGEGGAELPIIYHVYGSDQRRGVLVGMMVEGGGGDWFVIEAPATGSVRLEYHHEYLSDEMFWIQLRP